MTAAVQLFNPGAIVQLAGQTITSVNGQGLRVAFEVDRTLTRKPDSARVSIWNLDLIRRKAITGLFGELGKAPLQILAGYAGQTSILFTGDVRKLRAGRRVGPDVLTQVWADDGGDAIDDVNITLTTAGIDAATMIEVALKAFAKSGQFIERHPSVGITLAATSPEATVQFWSAVHVGKVSELLDQAARVLDCRWWIRNGLLYMAKRKVPTDGLTVPLPRTHWLGEPDEDGLGLVRLPVLMDKNIEPGRPVLIEGLPYRVEACTYRGDTRSGPWSVDIIGRRSA